MEKDNKILVSSLFAAVGSTYILYKFFRYLEYERERKASFALLRSPLDYEKHALKYGNPVGALYFGYLSGTGETYSSSRAYFEKLKFVPRSMVGAQSSCSTNYFGRQVSCPLIIAPTALHALADKEGEVATAKGAGQADVVYCFNYSLSSQSIEKIAEQPGQKWLHLYLFIERNIVEYAIEEALEKYKGVFSAIIVTLDHPHNRVRDTVVPHFKRLFYHVLPTSLHSPYMPNLSRAAGLNPAPTAFDFFFKKNIQENFPGNNDSTLTWKDLAWLKEKIKGRVPLIGKGILHPQDAVYAIQNGCDAIVVSNHGGRQTDGSIPAIQALPEIVKVVKELRPDVKVFCDTGVRTSLDVIRILALGGDGALIGRSPLFALMCGGSDSLRNMLLQWKEDIECDMRCLGLANLKIIPKDLLYKE